jgi:hypothetical protein
MSAVNTSFFYVASDLVHYGSAKTLPIVKIVLLHHFSDIFNRMNNRINVPLLSLSKLYKQCELQFAFTVLNRSFMVYTLCPINLWRIRRVNTHRKVDKHTENLLENLRIRDQSRGLGIDGRIMKTGYCGMQTHC